VETAKLAAVASLLVAAASLLAAAYLASKLSAVVSEMSELRKALNEVEDSRQQLLKKLNELEEALRSAQQPGTAQAGNAWYPAVSGEVRAVAYILPAKASTPAWKERYGDRIYFYVYANLSEYRKLIEEDFKVISKVYNTVIVVVPADDTELFRANLALIDAVARVHGLKILWAVLPKWKYGSEDDYLTPGTPMNRLVVGLMRYLAGLNSTWKVAVWYGWSNRANPDDVVSFYQSLPSDLKPLYACWLDQPYAEVAKGLARGRVDFLVVTELYSEAAISAYSGLLERQMIVTGLLRGRKPGRMVEWDLQENIAYQRGRPLLGRLDLLRHQRWAGREVRLVQAGMEGDTRSLLPRSQSLRSSLSSFSTSKAECGARRKFHSSFEYLRS
jgi:hypothetical protein